MDEMFDFDKPVFKQLSHNDSGASTGNQAGFVIPRPLRPYFPNFKGKVTKRAPAPGTAVKAILVVRNREVAIVSTRYQFQSWGAKRILEGRLTGNLTAMRSESVGGDIVLFERNISDRRLYRITLIKKSDKRHKAILKAAAGKKWGAVDPFDPPLSEEDIKKAETEQLKSERKKDFSPFDNEAALTETHSVRVARSRAFQKIVSKHYGNKCAVCKSSFMSLKGKTEVEAAHIVPRGKMGADDARNGLLLCRAHHWAFDKGLWSVGENGKIILAKGVLGKGSNLLLKPFINKKLTTPKPLSLAPDVRALKWHREHVLGQF